MELYLESQKIYLSDDLFWWLTMCDLQQSSLTLDVTRPGMIEIVNYLKSTVGTESFIHSSRFNRIQEVTLVCHNVIQKTYLN